MIIIIIGLLLAVILETSGVAICWYLIGSLLVYARAKFAVVVPVIAVSGLLLDVLTPRTLGITPLVMLSILLVVEKLWGEQQEKIGGYYVLSVALVIFEGIVVGRSLLSVVDGLCALVLALVVNAGVLSRSQSRQLVVRREF